MLACNSKYIYCFLLIWAMGLLVLLAYAWTVVATTTLERNLNNYNNINESKKSALRGN